MSKNQLATYRLPIPNATRIGQVQVKTDRNGQHYIESSRVVEAVESGIHTAIKLANGHAFYVLTKDYRGLK